MFARHLAWLNAIPQPDKVGAAPAEPKSRQQELEEEGFVPEMPELEWGQHLVAYLMEIGPVMAAGMGSTAISFSELSCWQQQTGIRLSPWEARTLRRMSSEYASESQAAADLDRPAPFPSLDSARLQQARIDRKLAVFWG